MPPDLATPPPAETTIAPASAGPEPLLIDLAEAARLLSLSAKTLKRMAGSGELPGVVKVRRRRLVSVEALKRWIGEGCPELPPPADRPAPRRRRSR